MVPGMICVFQKEKSIIIRLYAMHCKTPWILVSTDAQRALQIDRITSYQSSNVVNAKNSYLMMLWVTFHFAVSATAVLSVDYIHQGGFRTANGQPLSADYVADIHREGLKTNLEIHHNDPKSYCLISTLIWNQNLYAIQIE